MSRRDPTARRRLILLGSTGSIGTSTLEVLDHLRRSDLAPFDVVGLAAGSRGDVLAAQADAWGVPHVAIADAGQAGRLDGVDHVHAGPDAAVALVEEVARPGDLVLGAMVGSAGLPATLVAIDRGCDVALANKETLVAAGALVMPRARERGIDLLPVDSEHNAIAQCLRAGRRIEEVKRIVLTASGGPFRAWPKERMETATVEAALEHPTWSMGPKISVDSATMMNKALEIIEAHWLFGLSADRIEVIVHPRSIVHGLVEFTDGSVLAQMGPPDMRTPIQSALDLAERLEAPGRQMDWTALAGLEFEPVDHDRFPAVRMARLVLEAGGTAGAVFNAANEEAVDAFLGRRIPFGRIPGLVQGALEAIPAEPIRDLPDVFRADEAARRFVRDAVDRGSTASRRGQTAASRPGG